MGLRLWDPEARVTSDEAGTTITKYVLPPAYNPGPYERDPDGDEEHGLTYAPSLAYFCVKALIEVADQVHLIGSARLRYRAPEVEGSYDPLRALLPSYGTDAFDLSKVDPRLWAVLIQVYENLPDDIRTYRLPLADKHFPLLQSIPSTLDFTLITLLDLSRCPELTDNTIVELKALHCLVALDASMTEVSTHGIRGLSRTLQCTVDQETGMKRRGGPWGLRILRLRRCEKLSDAIFSCLASFPLLSLVDIRGTRCNPEPSKTGCFQPCRNERLRSGALRESLGILEEDCNGARASENQRLFSSTNTYILEISTLEHESRRRTRAGMRSAARGSRVSHALSLRLRGGGNTSSADEFERADTTREDSSRAMLTSDAGPCQEGPLTQNTALPRRPRHHVERSIGRDMTDNPSEVEDWEHEEIELHPSEYGNFDGQTHCEDHDSAGEYSDSYDCGDYPSFYEHEGRYDPRAYDSESDYDRIADEEGAAERHSQSARWFYGVGSSRRPPARLEGPDTLPKYVDDPNYLLYRSPPPWSVLGEIKPTDGSAGAAERRNEEDLVAVNRTNKKARLAVHMMKDMISKKKAKQIVDVGDSGGSNLAPIQSRNPFRKAPKIADNIAQMRSPATVMEGRPLEMSPNPLAIEPALHELGMEVQSTARVASLPVLRPVSAHKVPALPSPPPTQKKQQGRKPVKEKTPHRPPQRKRGGLGMSSAGGKVDGQKHKQFDWQAWGKPREST